MFESSNLRSNNEVWLVNSKSKAAVVRVLWDSCWNVFLKSPTSDNKAPKTRDVQRDSQAVPVNEAGETKCLVSSLFAIKTKECRAGVVQG